MVSRSYSEQQRQELKLDTASCNPFPLPLSARPNFRLDRAISQANVIRRADHFKYRHLSNFSLKHRAMSAWKNEAPYGPS